MKHHGNRLIVTLSDIEMAAGDAYDDFPQSDFLAEFISQYNSPSYQGVEIDLVFNGDTFDFLKLSVEGKFPHLIDSQIALHKLRRIYSAHKIFFDAVSEFVSPRYGIRRVHFVVGNHDMELLFPEVQNQITSFCGGSGQILFPGFELQIGDVHIEHGNQLDALFAIDPQHQFITHSGKKVLNLPWASVTIFNAIMPYHSEFYELDRIKPRDIVFEKLPGLKEFSLSLLWNYWTKDILKRPLRAHDPLKKISWSMFKETVKRSFMFNHDVEVEDKLVDQMREESTFKVFIIGHMHEQKLVSHGNRKCIQLGCFRNEFMYEDEDQSFELIPKNFSQIWLKNNKAVVSEIKETQLTDCEQVTKPKSFEFYAQIVKKKLGDEQERIKEKKEIAAQEAKEKAKIPKTH